MTSRVVLVAVMTGALLADLSGQQPQPTSQPIFRSRTDLVQVDAVVIDAEGRPMLGLKKSDFVLVDRKTQQVIDAFEEVSHSPISAPVFPATLKADVADEFSATEGLRVFTRLSGAAASACTPVLVSIARPEGVAVRSVAVQQNAGAIDTIVPLNDLLPGSYVLRAGCGVAPDAATREIGFVVK